MGCSVGSNFCSNSDQDQNQHETVFNHTSDFDQVTQIKENLQKEEDPDLLVYKQILQEIKLMKDDIRKKYLLEHIQKSLDLNPSNSKSMQNTNYTNYIDFVPNQAMLQEFKTFDFKFWEYSNEYLIEAIIQIMYDLEYCKGKNKIEQETLLYLGKEIQIRYKENPYHNFKHAFSVFQFTFQLWNESQFISKAIDGFQFLGLLIACLGHDIGHLGVNNMFLIQSKHSLAILYNDSSVLENHHAAVLSNILNYSKCNILKSYSEQDQIKMRKQIIQTILSTDMTKHQMIVTQIQQKNGKFESEADKQIFLNYLIHLADVHNPCLSWDISKRWSLLLVEEFNQQTMKEQEMNLPVTIFMQLGRDIEKIKKNQIGFIGKFLLLDAFIMPTYSELIKISPELKKLIKNCEINKENWNKIVSYEDVLLS